MTTLHRLKACYHHFSDPDAEEDEDEFPIHHNFVRRLKDVRQHPFMQASTLLTDTAGIEVTGCVLLMTDPHGALIEHGIAIRIPERARRRDRRVRLVQDQDAANAGTWMSLDMLPGPRWICVDRAGLVMECEPTLRQAAWYVCTYGTYAT